MPGGNVPVDLANVVQSARLDADGAEARIGEAGWLTGERDCGRGRSIAIAILWIETTIEEEFVLLDVSTKVSAEIVVASRNDARRHIVNNAIHIGPRCLELSRRKVRIERSMKNVA